MPRLCSCAIFVAVLAADAALAQTVRLRSGDVLVGTVLAADDDVVLLEHAMFGKITLPRGRVESIEGESTPTGTDQHAPLNTPPAPAAPDATAPPPSWRDAWSARVDLGFNGSSGNADTASGRMTLGVKRDGAKHALAADIDLNHAAASGSSDVTRASTTLRADRKLADSRWSFFAQARAETDSTQDWAWRASGFAGPSLRLIDSPRSAVAIRAGAGLTREFGGPGDGARPEGLVGLDLSRRLTDRSRVFGTVEAFPSLEATFDGRIDARAGYEVLLDEASRMSLRVGLADRYTTTPGSTGRNDLTYFLTIGWDF